MNLIEIKRQIFEATNEIRNAKRGIKAAVPGSIEQSQLQSRLHFIRIQNRANYLIYGLVRGKGLCVTENKIATKKNDYELNLLDGYFWKGLSETDGNSLTKESASQMLKTHLKR